MRIVPRTGGAVLTCALALSAAFLARPARAADTPWLGVYMQEITPDLRDGMNYGGAGVLVRRVVEGSPADHAGIQRGDVIVRLGSREIHSPDELTRAVRQTEAGRTVTIEIVRDGDHKTLDATLAARPGDSRSDDFETPTPPEAPEAPTPPTPPMIRFHGDDDNTPPPDMHSHDQDNDGDEDNDNDTPTPPDNDNDNGGRTHIHIHDQNGDHDIYRNGPGRPGMIMDLPGAMGRGRLGVRVESLNPDLASYFGPRGMKGALVLDVTDGSAADKAGIRAGDVITRVDSKSIDDADDLIGAIRSAEGHVTLSLVRHGAHQSVEASLEAMPKTMELRRQMRGGDNWTPNGNGFGYGYGNGRRMQGMSDQDRAQLRRQIEDMRKQIKELKEQLKEQDKQRDNE